MWDIFITIFLFLGCVAKGYCPAFTFFSLFVVTWFVRILCKKPLDELTLRCVDIFNRPDVAEQDGIAHSASRASALASQPLGAMAQQCLNINPLTPNVPRVLQFGSPEDEDRGVNGEFNHMI